MSDIELDDDDDFIAYDDLPAFHHPRKVILREKFVPAEKWDALREKCERLESENHKLRDAIGQMAKPSSKRESLGDHMLRIHRIAADVSSGA